MLEDTTIVCLILIVVSEENTLHLPTLHCKDVDELPINLNANDVMLLMNGLTRIVIPTYFSSSTFSLVLFCILTDSFEVILSVLTCILLPPLDRKFL